MFWLEIEIMYDMLRYTCHFSFPPATADTSSSGYPCTAEYGGACHTQQCTGRIPRYAEVNKVPRINW